MHIRTGRTDHAWRKHVREQQRAGPHEQRHREPRPGWGLVGIVAVVGLLAALLAGCSETVLNEQGVDNPRVFDANPQVFEAESHGAVLGAGWATQPDLEASGEIALVAAPSSASNEAPARLDRHFAVGAGATTVHLRLWAPESKETSVTLGFDTDMHEIPITGSGRYTWIATPSVTLAAGPHAVTIAVPREGVRYDLFVVAQDPLTDDQLNALADLPTDATPPGSDPAEPGEPTTDPTEPDPTEPGPTEPGPTEPQPGKPEPTEPLFPTDKTFPDRRAGLYGATLEWSTLAPKVKGDEFDVEASATFVDEGDGTSITTDLFYDGDGVYRFRFAPTGLGRWTFEVKSETEALDGLSGAVTVVPTDDAGARGFYQAVEGKIAVPVGNDSHLQGVPYQVYMRGNGALESIDRLPTNPESLGKALDDALDEAENAGFSAVFVGVWNNWFSLGDPRWNDHHSVDPDLATFRLLETLIERAHARGMGVHIWSWGDNQLKTTQIGVKGGIGGAADRRLQRYIAARLGPIPGWTMAYGFDLHEWVKPAQVRTWADAINDQSGWPHLLTARQQSKRGMSFFLEQDQLPLVSNDIRTDPVGYKPYQDALDAFKDADGKPVLFERRFLFGRDSVWTMDATRRAMWQLTMAGGAASFWGIRWDDSASYTKPGQLRAFQDFWRTRLDVDLSPRKEAGTLVLTSGDGQRVVAYRENTKTLSVPVTGGGRAIAIDTRSERYEEIPLDPPGKAGTWTWRAPRKGDWAIAFVGR